TRPSRILPPLLPPRLIALAPVLSRGGRAGVTVRRHPPGRRGSTTHRSLVTCVCRADLAGHLAITPLPRSRRSVLLLLGRARIRGEAGPGLRLIPNPLIPGRTALAGRGGRAGVTVRRHLPGRGSTTHRSLVACVCRADLAGHLAITPLPRSRRSVLLLLGRARIRGEAGPGLRLIPNPLIPGRTVLAPVLSRGGSRS